MSHEQVIEQVQVEVFNSTSIACELDPAEQATKLCVSIKLVFRHVVNQSQHC